MEYKKQNKSISIENIIEETAIYISSFGIRALAGLTECYIIIKLSSYKNRNKK
jgi:hypothetical protein